MQSDKPPVSDFPSLPDRFFPLISFLQFFIKKGKQSDKPLASDFPSLPDCFSPLNFISFTYAHKKTPTTSFCNQGFMFLRKATRLTFAVAKAPLLAWLQVFYFTIFDKEISTSFSQLTKSSIGFNTNISTKEVR